MAPMTSAQSSMSSDERWAAIQLAQLNTQRIQIEATKAANAGDLERLKRLGDEQEAVLEGMRRIREDQIMEELARRQPKPRRRWWRRSA